MKNTKKTKLFTLLCILLLTSFVIPQIVEEDIYIEEEKIKAAFAGAVKKFNSLEQASSIFDFNKIIVLLESARRDKHLSDSLIHYLTRAYEYRARAYFNGAEIEKTKNDIRTILRIDIDYIPAKQASRKFISLFKDIQKSVTGYFVVKTEPAGARIYIDEKFIGYSNTPVLKQHSGTYTIRASMDDYKTVERKIEIKPAETTELTIDMERISAAIIIHTVPPGAQVFLNGKYHGTTSGTVEKEYEDALTARGIKPRDCSSGYTITGLPVGSNQRVELKKPCYQPVIFRLNIESAMIYSLEPIIMETSQGEIFVENVPQDARVYLNGILQGKGDQQFRELCSGPYTLVVQFKEGKYLKQFHLHKNETIHIIPSPKPTVLFGGVLGLKGEVSFEYLNSIDITEILKKIETLNIYTPTLKDRNENQNLIQDLKRLGDSLNPAQSDGCVLRGHALKSWKEKLLNKYDAELLLVIKQVDDERFAVLLYHHEHNTPDIFEVILDEAGDKPAKEVSEALKLLDQIPEFQRPWLGIYPIETDLDDGLFIIEVREDSPAENLLQQGDYLLFLNSRRMTDLNRYHKVVYQLKQGEQIPIKIKRDGKILDLQIKPALTTITPEPSKGFYCFNRVLAELEMASYSDVIVGSSVVIPYLKGVLCYYLEAYQMGKANLIPIKGKNTDSLDSGLIHFFLYLIYTKTGDTVGAKAEREIFMSFPDARLYYKNGTRLSLMEKYNIYP